MSGVHISMSQWNVELFTYDLHPFLYSSIVHVILCVMLGCTLLHTRWIHDVNHVDITNSRQHGYKKNKGTWTLGLEPQSIISRAKKGKSDSKVNLTDSVAGLNNNKSYYFVFLNRGRLNRPAKMPRYDNSEHRVW